MVGFLFYRVAIFLFWTLKYQLNKKKFADLPRFAGKHPLPMFLLYDPQQDVCDTFEKLKGEDGSFHKLINMGADLAGNHAIFVTDADAFRLMLTDIDTFPKWKISYELLPFFGEGLVASSGELWKQQRRLITPLFHFGVLKLIHPRMVEESTRLVKKLEK